MTMRVFTSTELDRMQIAQDAAMMDRCDLLVKFETDRVDQYGAPVFEWVSGATVACGLYLRASQEMINAETHLYDAMLRLPINTRIGHIDRVRVTHRFGLLQLTPLEFDLVGDPRPGPSGLVINLRTVTNV